MQPPAYSYGPPPPQGYAGYTTQPQAPPQGQGGPGITPGIAPSSYPGMPPQQPAYGGPSPYQQAPLQQQQHTGMTHVGSYPGPMMGYGQAPPPMHYAPQQQTYGTSPYTPGPPSTGAPQAPGPTPAMAGTGFMSGISPMSLMTAGGLLAAPQQYMQQRVSWLKTNMTGGTMSALFNVNQGYVVNKLMMLLTPFLGRWTYARTHEQVAGGQRYRPPCADVNAPDLYVPLMAVWAYALLCCGTLAAKHTFKPDAMSSALYSASFAWGIHWLAARLLLRALGVVGVAWSELLAYTGYPFVGVCAATAGGFVAGRWGYYGLGGYCALCTAIFMVKTMKRVIFQETRTYGTDMRTANYLLLGLALFQFPFAFWMAPRPT